MASSTLPSTSDRSPPNLHRTFTLPSKLSDGVYSRTASKGPEVATIETLFAHNAARIVAFSPPISESSTRGNISGDASAQETELVGVLPWATRTERTEAVGPLSVYRVPGSVAFLSSGRILHPILGKSRCWCVDGETKFVLRIRMNNYYRIELPNTCPEDINVADNLKRTFSQLLQYETTPCPFKRGFYVEVPDAPETPKKPWRPKHSQRLTPSAKSDSGNGSECSSVKSGHDGSSVDGTDDERVSRDISTGSPLSQKQPSSHYDVGEYLASEAKAEPVDIIIRNFEELRVAAGSTDPTRQGDMSLSLLGMGEKDQATKADLNRRDSRLATIGHNPEAVELDSDLIVGETGKGEDSEHRTLLEHRPEQHSSVQGERVAMLLGRGPSSQDAGAEVLAREIPKESEEADIKLSKELEDDTRAIVPCELHRISRTLTAPPCLQTKLLPQSTAAVETPLPKDEDTDTISSASSLDSFHSFCSPVSPFDYSSPLSQATSASAIFEDCLTESIQIPQHRHSVSQLTITPESTARKDPSLKSSGNFAKEGIESTNHISSAADADTEDSEASDSSQRTSPASTLRRRLKYRRANSPLPSEANIYTPGVHVWTQDFTTLVFYKTCSILLRPPIQLAALMLDIAKRIAEGAIASENKMYAENDAYLPCSWDDEDNANILGNEDDYGLPISGFPSHQEAERRRTLSEQRRNDNDVD